MMNYGWESDWRICGSPRFATALGRVFKKLRQVRLAHIKSSLKPNQFENFKVPLGFACNNLILTYCRHCFLTSVSISSNIKLHACVLLAVVAISTHFNLMSRSI